jgi:hypothetical protein
MRSNAPRTRLAVSVVYPVNFGDTTTGGGGGDGNVLVTVIVAAPPTLSFGMTCTCWLETHATSLAFVVAHP